MDNSQSSDVFSDTSLACNSSTEIISQMDALTYDTLLHKTKSSLCNSSQISKVTFPSNFTSLLEDCRLCITQSLDLVVNVLLDTNVQLSKLTQYMEDAVCLLQQLSSLIKAMVESISLSCCLFKTFPTTTGHIIMTVFTHCKSSESVYGLYLNDVQKHLKDLFRTCHELQLTYLMVLEKHFIFDLIEDDQLRILIEALDLNLRIGEVAQSLDVKTMAEQWKAYMVLCEKYAGHLVDKHTYQECTQLLCISITNNLTSATEVDQDDKVVVRSLKVTNFTIKILLKMCGIFKHATLRDFTQIIDLLIYIYLHNPAYLQSIQGRHPQFINALSTNICNPSDLLLKELIMDDKFINVILAYTTEGLKDEKLLGFLFLMVGIIKCTLQKLEQAPNYPKHKLLHCIFKLLPQCNIWLNMGIKFKTESDMSKQSIGLFEYLLIHCVGLAVTMSGEEICHLEKTMYEALFNTESVIALFSSNLWVTLSRIHSNKQMLFGQVVCICQTYQKLSNNKTFAYSPQKLHISHTLAALFKAMRQEDKVRLFKQFNPIENRTNDALWSVLGIKNLPKELQRSAQEEIIKRYRNVSNVQTEESIIELIQVMRLASSCSFPSTADVEDCLVQEWMRACPVRWQAQFGYLRSSTLWYFEYIQALVSWTCAVERVFCDDSVCLIKVLHGMLNVVKLGVTEFNLLLIDLLCKLAPINVHNENNSVAALVEELFQLLVNSNSFVSNKVLRSASSCHNKSLEQIVTSAISKTACKEAWSCFRRYRTSNDHNIPRLKERLIAASDLKFVHKCMEARHEFEQISESVDKVHKTGSSNFDFADLDTLFDNVSDSEPASKRLKLDITEAEGILNRLETDTSTLCNVKENMFTNEHRQRIKGFCEKLKSLIT